MRYNRDYAMILRTGRPRVRKSQFRREYEAGFKVSICILLVLFLCAVAMMFYKPAG